MSHLLFLIYSSIHTHRQIPCISFSLAHRFKKKSSFIFEVPLFFGPLSFFPSFFASFFFSSFLHHATPPLTTVSSGRVIPTFMLSRRVMHSACIQKKTTNSVQTYTYTKRKPRVTPVWTISTSRRHAVKHKSHLRQQNAMNPRCAYNKYIYIYIYTIHIPAYVCTLCMYVYFYNYTHK